MPAIWTERDRRRRVPTPLAILLTVSASWILAVALGGGVAPWGVPSAAAADAALQTALIPFSLEDQFGKTHRRADYLGRLVVLIGSDRDGSKFNKRWGAAIDERLESAPRHDRLVFVPLADLRGAPGILKRMIRGKFPKEREKWTLMDWKGVLPKAYGFTPKRSNILVFAPDGELVHRVAVRALDAATLNGIVAAARPFLEDPGD